MPPKKGGSADLVKPIFDGTELSPVLVLKADAGECTFRVSPKTGKTVCYKFGQAGTSRTRVASQDLSPTGSGLDPLTFLAKWLRENGQATVGREGDNIVLVSGGKVYKLKPSEYPGISLRKGDVLSSSDGVSLHALPAPGASSSGKDSKKHVQEPGRILAPIGTKFNISWTSGDEPDSIAYIKSGAGTYLFSAPLGLLPKDLQQGDELEITKDGKIRLAGTGNTAEIKPLVDYLSVLDYNVFKSDTGCTFRYDSGLDKVVCYHFNRSGSGARAQGIRASSASAQSSNWAYSRNETWELANHLYNFPQDHAYVKAITGKKSKYAEVYLTNGTKLARLPVSMLPGVKEGDLIKGDTRDGGHTYTLKVVSGAAILNAKADQKDFKQQRIPPEYPPDKAQDWIHEWADKNHGARAVRGGSTGALYQSDNGNQLFVPASFLPGEAVPGDFISVRDGTLIHDHLGGDVSVDPKSTQEAATDRLQLWLKIHGDASVINILDGKVIIAPNNLHDGHFFSMPRALMPHAKIFDEIKSTSSKKINPAAVAPDHEFVEGVDYRISGRPEEWISQQLRPGAQVKITYTDPATNEAIIASERGEWQVRVPGNLLPPGSRAGDLISGDNSGFLKNDRTQDTAPSKDLIKYLLDRTDAQEQYENFMKEKYSVTPPSKKKRVKKAADDGSDCVFRYSEKYGKVICYRFGRASSSSGMRAAGLVEDAKNLIFRDEFDRAKARRMAESSQYNVLGDVNSRGLDIIPIVGNLSGPKHEDNPDKPPEGMLPLKTGSYSIPIKDNAYGFVDHIEPNGDAVIFSTDGSTMVRVQQDNYYDDFGGAVNHLHPRLKPGMGILIGGPGGPSSRVVNYVPGMQITSKVIREARTAYYNAHPSEFSEVLYQPFRLSPQARDIVGAAPVLMKVKDGRAVLTNKAGDSVDLPEEHLPPGAEIGDQIYIDLEGNMAILPSYEEEQATVDARNQAAIEQWTREYEAYRAHQEEEVNQTDLVQEVFGEGGLLGGNPANLLHPSDGSDSKSGSKWLPGQPLEVEETPVKKSFIQTSEKDCRWTEDEDGRKVCVHDLDEGPEETHTEAAARFYNSHWQEMFPKSGKGRFVLQAHWRGLSLPELKMSHEELLKTDYSVHCDLRLEIDETKLWGFTIFEGSTKDIRSTGADAKVLVLPPGDSLQGAFKLEQPHAWLDIASKKPYISAPGGVGATSRKYSKFIQLDFGTYDFSFAREHGREIFLKGSKLKGRMLMEFAPMGGKRVWLISKPESQEPYTATHKLDDVISELSKKDQKYLVWSAAPGSTPKVININGRTKVDKSYYVDIIKADEDKQIILGVVLEPDTLDAQKDRIRAEEIEKAAHRYLVRSRVIGKDHSGKAKAELVESYIVPVDMVVNGELVLKGSWVIAVHVLDDELWLGIRAGEYTGFSVGGFGVRMAAA